MSSEDKFKLEGIDVGANNYILPDASGFTKGGVLIGDNISVNNGEISLNQLNIVSALGYTPPMQDTTYEVADLYNDGLMSSNDKAKLEGIEDGANKYVLPTASNELGGIKLGYTENDNNIPVLLNDDKAYVEVTSSSIISALGYTPPTQDTTYNVMTGANSSRNGSEGLVPAPIKGEQNLYLKGDGSWDTPINTTYSIEGGTNKITVTPSAGQSYSVDITPEIVNNVTYSGSLTSGRLAIFDGVDGKIKASEYTINSSVPAGAKFTDTIYEPPTYTSYVETPSDETPGFGESFVVKQVKTNEYGHVTEVVQKTVTIPDVTATIAEPGLMSANDKIKLDNIATNAEVNQNAFTKISNGTTIIEADSKQDTLNIASGSGITLTLDAANDKLTIAHSDTSTLSGSYGPSSDVTGSNGNTIVVPQITVDEFGHVTGVSNKTYTSKDTTYEAMTANDLSAGTGTTDKVVSAKVMADYVKGQIDDKIAAADAMIYKGTIGTNGTVTSLPATHKTGWTYKVITAGTYAGVKCEVGDMIICLTDGTSANNAHWTVVQYNVDGAVTNTATSVVTDTIAIFDGTSGRAIKSSNHTIGTSVPANAVFTDTKVTNVSNHYSPSADSTKELVAGGATATDVSGATLQVVTGIQRDAAGHVVGITSGAVKATDTKSFTITANASDDDIVVLNGTNGTNAVTYSASHAKKGPSNGYTSNNTTTSISGSAGTGTIKVPQITVDEYGHVTSAVDESITITMPTIPTLASLSGVGSVSATGTAPLTLNASKSGTAVSITGSVATMGAASSSVAGSAGLVPAPAAGKNTSFLRGDGQWMVPANDNTTYTFASGTNEFTVTPKGGTAQTVTVTPSITNNVTYTGTWTAGQVASLDSTTGKVKASGYTIASNVPANAKFTDTTYEAASTSANGLMTSAMVSKLNGIQESADAVSFTRSLTSGTKIGTITINGAGTDIYCNNNTTYSAGTGITLDGTTINHTNAVTAKTAYGSTATSASAAGGTIKLTDVKYDAQGHITGSTDRTITLSQDHTKTSIAAGTAGTSSDTTGKTISIPYVTMNANGHVTAYGTHTHTITGFLESEQYKGTVTSVATGVGLTGGTITNTGTLKAKLRSETALTVDATVRTEATDKVYPVGVDKSGYLAVNVPWTTYTAATTSTAGLMSAGDKTKLDGIETGAQKNTITGIKGSSESSYRTGNVNITKANIGLSNVDDTADADKPISTATQTALNGKAPTSHASNTTTYGVGTTANYGHVKISNNDVDSTAAADGLVAGMDHTHSLLAPKASPAFTGTPTAPTAAAGTNTTQIASTAFVTSALVTKQDKKLSFTSVSASSWTADSTYADFGYVCSISCSGVTSDMYAEVVFDVAQATSGNYAPVCETGSGIVKIWSSTNASITIPVIIVHK